MYLVPKRYYWHQWPEDNVTGFIVESVHEDGSSFSPEKKVTCSGTPKLDGYYNQEITQELRTPTGETCKFKVTAIGTPGNGNGPSTLSPSFVTTEVPEPPNAPADLSAD